MHRPFSSWYRTFRALGYRRIESRSARGGEAGSFACEGLEPRMLLDGGPPSGRWSGDDLAPLPPLAAQVAEDFFASPFYTGSVDLWRPQPSAVVESGSDTTAWFSLDAVQTFDDATWTLFQENGGLPPDASGGGSWSMADFDIVDDAGVTVYLFRQVSVECTVVGTLADPSGYSHIVHVQSFAAAGAGLLDPEWTPGSGYDPEVFNSHLTVSLDHLFHYELSPGGSLRSVQVDADYWGTLAIDWHETTVETSQESGLPEAGSGGEPPEGSSGGSSGSWIDGVFAGEAETITTTAYDVSLGGHGSGMLEYAGWAAADFTGAAGSEYSESGSDAQTFSLDSDTTIASVTHWGDLQAGQGLEIQLDWADDSLVFEQAERTCDGGGSWQLPASGSTSAALVRLGSTTSDVGGDRTFQLRPEWVIASTLSRNLLLEPGGNTTQTGDGGGTSGGDGDGAPDDGWGDVLEDTLASTTQWEMRPVEIGHGDFLGQIVAVYAAANEPTLDVNRVERTWRDTRGSRTLSESQSDALRRSNRRWMQSAQSSSADMTSGADQFELRVMAVSFPPAVEGEPLPNFIGSIAEHTDVLDRPFELHTESAFDVRQVSLVETRGDADESIPSSAIDFAMAYDVVTDLGSLPLPLFIDRQLSYTFARGGSTSDVDQLSSGFDESQITSRPDETAQLDSADSWAGTLSVTARASLAWAEIETRWDYSLDDGEISTLRMTVASDQTGSGPFDNGLTLQLVAPAERLLAEDPAWLDPNSSPDSGGSPDEPRSGPLEPDEVIESTADGHDHSDWSGESTEVTSNARTHLARYVSATGDQDIEDRREFTETTQSTFAEHSNQALEGTRDLATTGLQGDSTSQWTTAGHGSRQFTASLSQSSEPDSSNPDGGVAAASGSSSSTVQIDDRAGLASSGNGQTHQSHDLTIESERLPDDPPEGGGGTPENSDDAYEYTVGETRTRVSGSSDDDSSGTYRFDEILPFFSLIVEGIATIGGVTRQSGFHVETDGDDPPEQSVDVNDEVTTRIIPQANGIRVVADGTSTVTIRDRQRQRIPDQTLSQRGDPSQLNGQLTLDVVGGDSFEFRDLTHVAQTTYDEFGLLLSIEEVPPEDPPEGTSGDGGRDSLNVMLTLQAVGQCTDEVSLTGSMIDQLLTREQAAADNEERSGWGTNDTRYRRDQILDRTATTDWEYFEPDGTATMDPNAPAVRITVSESADPNGNLSTVSLETQGAHEWELADGMQSDNWYKTDDRRWGTHRSETVTTSDYAASGSLWGVYSEEGEPVDAGGAITRTITASGKAHARGRSRGLVELQRGASFGSPDSGTAGTSGGASAPGGPSGYGIESLWLYQILNIDSEEGFAGRAWQTTEASFADGGIVQTTTSDAVNHVAGRQSVDDRLYKAKTLNLTGWGDSSSSTWSSTYGGDDQWSAWSPGGMSFPTSTFSGPPASVLSWSGPAPAAEENPLAGYDPSSGTPFGEGGLGWTGSAGFQDDEPSSGPPPFTPSYPGSLILDSYNETETGRLGFNDDLGFGSIGYRGVFAEPCFSGDGDFQPDSLYGGPWPNPGELTTPTDDPGAFDLSKITLQSLYETPSSPEFREAWRNFDRPTPSLTETPLQKCDRLLFECEDMQHEINKAIPYESFYDHYRSLALLAKASYAPSSEQSRDVAFFLQRGPWTEIERGSFDSGLEWAVYLNPDKRELIVAFAGTEGIFPISKDWQTNFANGFMNILPTCENYVARQYAQTVDVVRDVLERYPDCQITLVGHSLGATQATFAALIFNVKAVVFDPAGVNLRALATYRGDARNANDLVIAIVTQGEALCFVEAAADAARAVGLKGLPNRVGNIWKIPGGKSLNPIGRHSIDTAFKYLSKQYNKYLCQRLDLQMAIERLSEEEKELRTLYSK